MEGKKPTTDSIGKSIKYPHHAPLAFSETTVFAAKALGLVDAQQPIPGQPSMLLKTLQGTDLCATPSSCTAVFRVTSQGCWKLGASHQVAET